MERRFHASDAIAVAYAALLLALAVIFRARIEEWASIVAMTGAIVVGVPVLVWVARRWPNRWTRIASGWDIVVYIPVLFFLTVAMVWRVHRTDFDGQLIAMDRWLGLDRALAWAQSIENPWAIDAMKVAWISYYVLPVIPGLELWRRGSAHFWEAKTMVLLGLILAYLGYFATPALGGQGVAPASSGAVVFNSLSHAIATAEGADARDTYPSGHVMTSLVAIAVCVRHRLRIGWVTIPLALAIMFSTIYLRYHYVIDCVAGLWMGAGAIFLGWWMCRDRSGVEFARERSWARAAVTALAAALAGVLVVAGAGVARRAYGGDLPQDPILVAAVVGLPLSLGILLACAWSAIDGGLRGYAVARLDPRGLTVGRRRLAWNAIASLAVVDVDRRREVRASVGGAEVVLVSRLGAGTCLDDLVRLGNAYRRTHGTTA